MITLPEDGSFWLLSFLALRFPGLGLLFSSLETELIYQKSTGSLVDLSDGLYKYICTYNYNNNFNGEGGVISELN